MTGTAQRVGIIVMAVLALTGCASDWQAPMESRGSHGSVTTPSHQATTARQTPSRVRAQSNQNRIYHRVQRGETLYSISWRYGKDFGELAKWNGIRAPYTIFPGQMLRLKPRASVANNKRKYEGGRKPVPAKPIPQAAKAKPATPVPNRQAAKANKSTPRPKVESKAKPKTKRTSLHWKWPVRGRILSRYSSKDATRNGLKLAGTVGQPIHAAEGGKVVYSGSGLIGYGRLIIIKHNDSYLSAYGHNSRLLVKEGEVVERGERIASMGSSNAGTAMLHFEVRRNGRPIDPLSLLPDPR